MSHPGRVMNIEKFLLYFDSGGHAPRYRNRNLRCTSASGVAYIVEQGNLVEHITLVDRVGRGIHIARVPQKIDNPGRISLAERLGQYDGGIINRPDSPFVESGLVSRRSCKWLHREPREISTHAQKIKTE